MKNKLNIENPIELARAEEKISKQKAILLWQNDDLKNFPAGTFKKLALIHKNLFEEIYYCAGENSQ